jgi:formylglycine-generating enzyme required for sulfatase activity
VLAEAQTCVDTEKTRAPVALIETKADDGLRGPSAQGSWLAGEPCPADDGGDRVCVPGGATILGATDDVSSSMISARPVRLFGVRRFYLDRHEVTVGRFREAIAAGFHPPYYPVANEGPLGSASTAQQCTWSTQAKDREDYALSCIAWFSARDFCLWAGGALPTELQWEHAATVAGHASKVHYPWGNETPSCDEVAFGGAAQGTGLPECPDAGPLPRPLSASAGDLAPSGAVGLAGGVSEWVLDDAVPYADACWGDAPIVDAHCGDPAKPASWRIARGAFYSGPLTFATTRYKVSSQDQSTFVGFRCAYPEGAP